MKQWDESYRNDVPPGLLNAALTHYSRSYKTKQVQIILRYCHC